MSSRGQRRVFISATSAGFGRWRERIADILLAHDIVPDEQGAFAAGSELLIKQISDKIHESDGVICLIGPFYGHPSPRKEDEYQLSYTQYEWFHAHHLGRRCLTFVVGEPLFGEWKRLSTESPDYQERQEQFVEVVKCHGFAERYRVVSIQSELALALELAKIDWRKWLGDISA